MHTVDLATEKAPSL